MPVWLHLKPKWVGKVRERKKVNIAVLFRSNPTRNIMASFQAKTGRERPRTSENKNFRSEHFLPDP